MAGLKNGRRDTMSNPMLFVESLGMYTLIRLKNGKLCWAILCDLAKKLRVKDEMKFMATSWGNVTTELLQKCFKFFGFR